MTLAVSQAFRDALLVGGLEAFLNSFGDEDAERAVIEFFGTVQPGPGVVTGDAPLVTVVLAAPCTNFLDGFLYLVQQEAAGDLILAQGELVWGRLRTANGTWAADGSASVAGGSGDFQVSGTDGVLLYEGARAILGVTKFG